MKAMKESKQGLVFTPKRETGTFISFVFFMVKSFCVLSGVSLPYMIPKRVTGHTRR